MQSGMEAEEVGGEQKNCAELEQWLVSIIVPVYNVEAYLRECVESILAQTYRNFELLLIDDGSKDGSGAICDEFAQSDSRVRVIHKANEGPSITRNRGIEEAAGEFIVFVDSDDLVCQEMLEKMVCAMTRYQTDLAICGFERFRDDWKQRSRISPYSLVIFQSQRELTSIYNKPGTNMFGISIWAKMYRADIIRENNIRFQEDIDYEEDCCFNVDYFHHVQTTAVLRDYFYQYRQLDQSLSKGYRKNTFKFLINGFRRRKAFLEELEMPFHGAETILMIVIKTTLIKIFDSALSKEEKFQEYEMVMSFDECQEVCKDAIASKTRLTRMLAKAIISKNPKKVHHILLLWRVVAKVKGKIKGVLRRIKWCLKKVLRREVE